MCAMPSETPIEGRCGRKLAKKPGYCERYPAHGLDYCASHGAATKRSKAKAARVIAEMKCRTAMERLGHPVDGGELHEQMVAAVHAAYGDYLYYRAEVQLLDTVTGEDTGPGGARYETVRSLVKLYHEAEQWWAKVVKLAIDVGVDERRIRVDEAQTSILLGVLQATLAELGLGDDQHAKEVVARHLRAVN